MSRGLRARHGFLVLAVLIVIIGLAFRAALMLSFRHTPPSDPDNYLMLAQSLAEGQGFRIADRPTAYRPPLYPLALAPGVALLGLPATAWVVALHLASGAAAIGLTGLAARRWGVSDGATALAMLVVACDPVLVSQTRGVMTEPLASALVAGLLASIGPVPTFGSALRTGLIAGVAALCRPSLLPAALLIVAALALLSTGRWPRRAICSGVMLAALTATMAPWAIRNALVLGAPVWTTTHGGYTLFLANNSAYYDDVLKGPMPVWTGPNQAHWFAEVNRKAEGMPEPQADRWFRLQAVGVMIDRPTEAGRATLERVGRFWAVAPSSAVYSKGLRWLTAGWTIPLWGLLLLGLFRRPTWQWPRIAAPLALLSLAMVHSLYWTDLRMRAPVVPAIALIAVGGIGSAGGRRPCHTSPTAS
ncbi:dolichyl-phosphate-mannose-protein mannosyltransferase [Tautonia rosea]|uniref:dolichyl-phosphate-mannose-protein mannosyltransferase n=1 Tax=Tautonia rosea TaxID=2728037 RepID=UPI0014760AA1|nr:dolichyl-phosphate-mannose-protein mannosyltransferase [Tautonia rosea]